MPSFFRSYLCRRNAIEWLIHMKFRKTSLLFCQSTICYTSFILLCATLIPVLGLGLSFFYAIPFILLALVNPRFHNEFITIDESGISCNQAQKQIWAYTWNNIAFLKKSSRFLMPAIEVITYDKFGKPELFSLPNHYFQLGRTAKKAIRQYCELNKSYVFKNRISK